MTPREEHRDSAQQDGSMRYRIKILRAWRFLLTIGQSPNVCLSVCLTNQDISITMIHWFVRISWLDDDSMPYFKILEGNTNEKTDELEGNTNE